MEKTKQRFKNFYGRIKDRSKFLSNLKVITILILLEIYTLIYDKLSNNTVFVGYQQILVIAGLAILFTLLFYIIDKLIESQRLKEINESNKIISKEMFSMQYNIRRYNEEQLEIAKLGSKYEYCWNFMKQFSSGEENGEALLEAMGHIEDLADEHVDKQFEEIKRKNEEIYV